MAGASGIRAGRAYVEIGTRDAALVKGLRAAERRLNAFGDSIGSLGTKLAGLGATIGAPLAGAVRAFASYEDALASLRANAQPTADQLAQIETTIASVGRATGTGSAAVASAMTELLKAGLPLEAVLSGAAEAALQFAKVAEMDAVEAAVVLTDAMNVFGVDATTAVDALSKAADASSVSVQDVAMSMSMAGAVAKMAGLSIDETANAIAILGQNGVKGSDAGTSLKTMLLRLQTGAESAGQVMESLGINVRNADGSMMDLRGIIGSLQAGLAGLSGEARDTAMLKLFGTDAIRAGAILLDEGVSGWDDFNAAMAEGLPVSEKFEILMGTLSGQAAKLWASLQRIAIAVGKALAPGLATVTDGLEMALTLVESFAATNSGLIVTVAKVVGGLIAGGAALIALGVAAKVAAVAFGLLGTAVAIVSSPLGLVVAGAVTATAAFLTFTETGRSAFESVKATATAAMGGIAAALKAGNLQLAAQIAILGVRVEFQKGLNFLTGLWADWGVAVQTVFSNVSFAMAEHFTRTVGVLKKRWNEFGGFFAKVWARVKSLFTEGDLQAELDRINAGVATDNAAIDASTGDQLASLSDQQEAADANRFAGAQAAVAAGDAELKRLQGELATAIADAATTATPAGATPGVAGAGASGATEAMAALDPAALTPALSRAARSTDVAGSFSAASFRGMGVGSSIESDQLDESKKQTGLLERLNDRARGGRLVFTS